MTTIENVATRRTDALLGATSGMFLLLVAALTIPVLNDPWGDRPWVQATYLVSLIQLDGLIALFLCLESAAGSSSSRTLSWLAAGYLFTAVTALAQLLTFPGILDVPLAGLWGGQASAWLWSVWHTGFPCFVLLALGAKRESEIQKSRQFMVWHYARLVEPLWGVGLALLLSFLIIRNIEDLPVLVVGDDFSALQHSPIAVVVVLANVLAFAALSYVTRFRGLLYVWLGVAILAFTLDILLNLGAAARYTGGWYVGRGLTLASASSLMVALLIQHFRLQHDAEMRAALHESEAQHDPLTGLYNRRYMTAQLTQELGRAKRYRHPVSVLLLDLDHFKQINDTHGHKAGDDCLVAFAEILGGRVTRQGDFAARYGGEEFVVALSETGKKGAMEVAEEIRERTEGLYALHATPCPITVSIGVATVNYSATLSVEELLIEADKYLYLAKQAGRNRVVGKPATHARRQRSHPVNLEYPDPTGLNPSG